MAIDRESVLAAAQKFVEKKKYDKAIAEYQKILQVDPNDARTLLKVGDLQLKMEAYPESIATYERVGKFYAQQGFALKAIAVYKQIREIVGKHVPHLEERYGHIAPKLAELYQQLGLVSDALAALDEVATRLQRAQRDGEAIEIFKKIVALDPTNPLPHLRLAEAHSRARDADGAVSEFSVAASLLVRLNRRDDALKVLERLLHHRPDAAQARLAADLYLARGGPQDGMQALAKLQVCFQANPKDLDTLGLLAKAFGVIGQAGKGVEVQKEMARIARDQGKLDVMGEVVRGLEKAAPQDEAVRQLAQEYDAAIAQKSEEDVEEVEAEADASQQQPQYVPTAVPSEAEPFSLRSGDDGTDVEDLGDAPEMIEEGQFELVEDVDENVVSRVAQLLEDARSFSRVRLFNKAIETLISAAELDPRSIDVRVGLRDAYLESNRQEDATIEMINIASLQLDALDGDGAAQTLQEVMVIDPTNARASEMLRELGYELVEEPPASMEATQAIPRERFDSYDPEAPLPSYDLDEVPTHAIPAQRVPQFEEANTSTDQPLPSFPLEAAESEAQFELVKDRDDGPPPSMRSAAADIEEALEEAEFFASRGLFDDARAVLAEQSARIPNHPLLRERLAEIDAQEQTAQKGSGTRALPRQPTSSVTDDESFDIAASLDALEALDVAPEAANLMNETGQVDVEEVFAKFKEGVSKQLSVDDGQAHYDLGLAYKEMGLTADAKSEFEIAARDANRECVCRSMIGTIFLEAGELDKAIDAFQKGLAARVRTPEQETVLCFEIGACYETKRQNREALSYFHRVARRDPTYRDVEERLRRLSKPEVKPPVRALAVNAGEDEFDRAFDEMLGSDDDPKKKVKKLS